MAGVVCRTLRLCLKQEGLGRDREELRDGDERRDGLGGGGATEDWQEETEDDKEVQGS